MKRSNLLQAIKIVLASPPKTEKAAVVTVHSLRENRGKLKILLVEDNRVNQILATRLLEKRGHVVTAAENGGTALKAMKEGRFDLILMDIQMPEMNGLQATLAIRRSESESKDHVPIIAMTARALTGDREAYLAAGMDAYLTKPLNVADLFSTIEDVLAIPIST